MEKDGRKKLNIVAITASVLAAEIDKCYASGMDDFLSKPLDIRDLKIVLGKYLKLNTQKEKEPLPAKKPKNSTDKVIDTTTLIELVGEDPETLLEIYKDFVDPTKETIDEITNYYNSENTEGVGLSAHKLKSSSRAIGANTLADLCLELETAGKNGDLEKIKILFPDLEPYSKAVFQEIKEM